MINISIKEMFENGVHFGHQKKNWNPKMKPYIYGIHNNIHIINLDKTYELFKIALIELKNIYNNKGKILFVGTKNIIKDIIKNTAINCNQYFINNRWLGGTLTNWKTIKKSIKKLKDLQERYKEEVNYNKIYKKEFIYFSKKISKLKNNLDGIQNMNKLPDALFIIDVKYENIAVKEANKLKIPIFAIVDTNSDPENIDFIIPGNDDSKKAVNFYLSKVDFFLNN